MNSMNRDDGDQILTNLFRHIHVLEAAIDERQKQHDRVRSAVRMARKKRRGLLDEEAELQKALNIKRDQLRQMEADEKWVKTEHSALLECAHRVDQKFEEILKKIAVSKESVTNLQDEAAAQENKTMYGWIASDRWRAALQDVQHFQEFVKLVDLTPADVERARKKAADKDCQLESCMRESCDLDVSIAQMKSQVADFEKERDLVMEVPKLP